MATSPTTGLDLSQLDGTVQFFCAKGIAPSTHHTYQSALRKFSNFCSQYNIVSPFPVSEAISCYYAASQKLSPQTIKTYLAGIRHMQITLGLPEPKEFSSLPRLRLVQSGIKRVHAHNPPESSRIRLPITPAVLRQLHTLWSTRAADPDIVMLWAAAVMCFFSFFRSGELTIPSQNAYDQAKHLSWGDVAVDSIHSPKMLKVKLKQSKIDQLRQGVEVFIGKTGCSLCPVAATLAYMAIRGSHPGHFSNLGTRNPSPKGYSLTGSGQAYTQQQQEQVSRTPPSE